MKLKHLFTTLGLSLLASTALADNCAVDLSANDAMRYDKNEIAVDKTCKQFTVNFSHTGKLAKNVMGHNVVITKKDDSREVASEGAAAGPEKDYLKADDPRIIAHTKIIGGGENTSVTFDVSKLNEKDAYMFFCSFPGHIALMQGAVTLK